MNAKNSFWQARALCGRADLEVRGDEEPGLQKPGHGGIPGRRPASAVRANAAPVSPALHPAARCAENVRELTDVLLRPTYAEQRQGNAVPHFFREPAPALGRIFRQLPKRKQRGNLAEQKTGKAEPRRCLWQSSKQTGQFQRWPHLQKSSVTRCWCWLALSSSEYTPFFC